MRILNTVRHGHSYIFFLTCPACRYAAPVTAIAWDMPEAAFSEMFGNHRDWCRCVVCLQRLEAISYISLDKAQMKQAMLEHGLVPKPGRIEIIA